MRAGWHGKVGLFQVDQFILMAIQDVQQIPFIYPFGELETMAVKPISPIQSH
jgi:hypothetical protein